MNILRTITTTVKAIACMAFAASVISCSQEGLSLPETPKGSTDGEISILFEVEGDMPLSRGIAATAHERLLRDVYILFFEHLESESDSEVTADSYIGYVQAGASEGKSTISFDPPTYLRTDRKYRLLVVGNSDKYTLGTTTSYANYLAGFKAGSGYNEVRSKLLAERDEAITSTTPGVLPLSGRFVKQTTDRELYFTFSRTADGVVIPDDCIFRFQRALCRVDLHNLVGNVLDIRYMRIVNTRTMGSYFFDGLNQGDQPATTFSENAQSPGFVEMPEEFQGNNLQRLEATLYCFPNTVNTCLPDDKCTTAVMIAGYYIDPATNEKDENLTYYRFNIMNAGDSQALQRNYCYRASIKSVTRRGEDTEEKAYNATSPVFNYDISEEWDTDDDNAVSDSDGNFLVVSKSMLTFTGDQCGADVIKLTVNTNPEVTWDIEMDEESAGWFQYKKISEGQGEKIKAFTCGPTETNYSDYYRTGTLTIVARNNKTGKELRKLVRLVQLTTKGDVKCLVVNDYTTDFTQEVSQYGQTISFKINTGSPTNQWTASDYYNMQASWGENIDFTSSGTSGNYFTITFPANINNDRSITIKFDFKSNDSSYSNEINPIFVTFKQPKCDQPLTILNWPDNGVLVLDCFDTRAGWESSNCVAQSRKFTVRLARPDIHHFTVTSTFDKYRDLSLNDDSAELGFPSELRSFHPDLAYYDEIFQPQKTVNPTGYNSVLEDRTDDNSSFYINAFRMGPGDPTITGKITVQVKDEDGNDVPKGKLELSVMLMVPADKYMLNDVMIKDSINNKGVAQKEGWIYIMDRNMGCNPRVYNNNSKIITMQAFWSTKIDKGLTDSLKITGIDKINEEWLGDSPLEFPEGISHSSQPTESHTKKWKSDLMTIHKLSGRMYEHADLYPWWVLTQYTTPSFRKSLCISKSRYFILADETLCPTNSKGEIIRIASWLPAFYNSVYGYTSTFTQKFGSENVYLNPFHKQTKAYFGGDGGNNKAWSGRSDVKAHLIRLMFMIGNTQNTSWSLPKDSVDPIIEYYKNHILKCYEQQK